MFFGGLPDPYPFPQNHRFVIFKADFVLFYNFFNFFYLKTIRGKIYFELGSNEKKTQITFLSIWMN